MMFARHDITKLVGTAIAVAALGLTTVGNAAADSTDDAFVRKLFDDALLFGTPKAVIQEAHTVCDAFSTGPSPASVNATRPIEAMTPRQTALFIADAVQAYCPKYADQLSS